jgi:hypothetical protein
MCHAGAELEQILVGHTSVQTTERYLGTKQDLAHASNDGIKPRIAAKPNCPKVSATLYPNLRSTLRVQSYFL